MPLKNNMSWRQLLPTLVTLAAMLCGFFSMLLALEGSAHFMLAAQFIMLAMILDGLDGNLARHLKGTSTFGAELDTYVDMTAFGLAPAILIYQVSLQTYIGWRVLMTAMVVLSGVIRLARFKVSDPERGQAPCIVLVIMLFLRDMHLAPKAALAILFLGVSYVVFGPVYMDLMKRRCRTNSAT
ncbi:MAG: CDP-alcohol phosphatidyltransferase family protein [Lentisphaerae bacterium]|nr:CDP-alcohol phosphatidyltransferase family protein [Lentisphaerota bacterium]